MKAKPKTTKTTAKSVDQYLAKVPNEKRVALEKLRKAIKAAVPGADECISYQMPAFRLDGKFLVSFAAWADHCAFYPGSSAIEANKKELKVFEISKGTIRFQTDHPLSATLVRKLVKARIASA